MSATEKPDQPNGGGSGALKLLYIAIFAFLVVWMMLPTVGGPRSAGRSALCQSNMRNAVLAILNYEAVNKAYPQAVSYDATGQVARSWRVEVLPQLDLRALRNTYKDDQPWNSPANTKVATTDIPIFRCPAAREQPESPAAFTTSYALITGPGTVFPSDKRISGSDIKDGTSNTIMMIEIMDSDITWTEPRDLTIDEAIALFNRPESVRKKHPTNHQGGRMVAFADGHIDFAPEDTPPEVLRALFTIDDGIPVSLDSSTWSNFLDDE